MAARSYSINEGSDEASGFSMSISRGCDECFFYDCDPCKYRNITSEAMSYCTICRQYLCQTCEQTHKGLMATRDHKILTENDIPSDLSRAKPVMQIMFCENHKTLTLNMYCVDHDEVICSTCKITNHGPCNVTDIRRQQDRMKNDGSFSDTLTKLRDLKVTYENLKGTRNVYKEDIKSQIKDCLKELDQLREEIKETFNKLDNKLSTDIQNIREDFTKEADNHVTIIDDALVHLTDGIKSMENCEKSQNGDVMFVGMKKAGFLKEKFCNTMSKLRGELYQDKLFLKPNDVFLDLLRQLEFIGTIGIDRQPMYRSQTQLSLLDTSVADRRLVDVGATFVFDCKFVADGHTVISCGFDGLKLLGRDFTIKDSLSHFSQKMAAVNDNELIVSQGYQRQLLWVNVFPKLRVKRRLKIDDIVWCIDVFGDEIYVTYSSASNLRSEVRVLNMNGEVLRQLCIKDGNSMLKCPQHVKVSKDGSKIFISADDESAVLCVTKDGQEIFRCSDTNLIKPRAIYVDDEDNLLVSSWQTGDVYLFSSDGRKVKVLLSQTDGLKSVFCMAYRAEDGCLIVGMGKSSSLLVFTMKH